MDSAIGDISNPPCVSKFRKLAGVGDAVLNSERSCLMGTSLQKVRAADIIAFWRVSGAPSTMGPAFPALIGENSIASQGDIVEAPPLYSTLRAWGRDNPPAPGMTTVRGLQCNMASSNPSLPRSSNIREESVTLLFYPGAPLGNPFVACFQDSQR